MVAFSDVVKAGTASLNAAVNIVSNLDDAALKAQQIVSGLSQGNLKELHAGLQGFDAAAPGSKAAFDQNLALATTISTDPNVLKGISAIGALKGHSDLGTNFGNFVKNMNAANTQYANYAAADAADIAADSTWNPLDDASAKIQKMSASYQLNKDIKAAQSELGTIINALFK